MLGYFLADARTQCDILSVEVKKALTQIVD